MLKDLRLAARLLWKERGFAAAAVVTLMLGIAATNTVFTVVHGTLTREMPFDAPERLVDLGGVSYLDLGDWRERLRTVEAVAAFDERTMALADPELGAQAYPGAFVSANTFDIIGRPPALGRAFASADEAPGAPPVVILGQDVWRTRYRSDPSIVGRTIRINGLSAVVIGVMPDGFGFPMAAQLWQPISLLRGASVTNRGADSLATIARLRPDVTLDQASADLAGVIAALNTQYPETTRPVRQAVPFRSGVDADTPAGTAFLFMLGAVVIVLLIACANVANLLLVRAAARSRDVSVRLSLGASRWRIIRQLVAESFVLAALAGAGALALSALALDALWNVLAGSGQMPPYWLTFDFDARVFAFLAAIVSGAALLSGLAPAWLSTRVALVEALGDGGRGVAGTRRGRRWTGAFVVAQLALSLVLLSAAGFMVRSVLVQMRVDPGVDVSNLVTMRVEPAETEYDAAARGALYRRIEERLSALPGVTAAFATEIPLGGAPERALVTEAIRDADPADRPLVGELRIGGRYFETLGSAAVRGRTFAAAAPDSRAIAIVNERFAARFFPGGDPIGQRIRLVEPDAAADEAAPWVEIVGVAPNVRQRAIEGGDFDAIVYVPIEPDPPSRMNLLVRSRLDRDSLASLLRQEMTAIDPDLPLFEIRTFDGQFEFDLWVQRFTSSLFSIFAAIALALASVGLYGVTAYAASQRTKEIGLRVALGARAGHVWLLVTRSAMRQLGAGLALGLGGGLAVSRVLPAELGGAAGGDPLTVAAVAALLTLVGLTATAVPARAAVRVDPAVTLRSDG